MKKRFLILIWAVLGLLFLCSQSWAVCPEDPDDNGECDTMYVEVFPPDQQFMPPGPHLARFPVYVTHDLPDAEIDSIAAFVIPLCFTSSNPSASCHLPAEWNLTGVIGGWDQSIFRHLVDGTDTTRNWMLSLAEELTGKEWDTRILDISDGNHFWLAMFPSGLPDQRFWEGSRVLLATITFELNDTTTICVDSCFWPPGDHLAFCRSDAVAYVPRHLLPICEPITLYGPPPHFAVCPGDQTHAENGTGFASAFEAFDSDGEVVGVDAGFSGSGVENVTVEYTAPPPAPVVEGRVRYDVVDHCQQGGTVSLTAWDDLGQGWDDCDFYIILANDPPAIGVPATWLALAGYTMVLKVPAAVDPNADSVGAVAFDALWFELDSLQAPTKPPTYSPGDPGFFTWVPEEADTGTWICSFSATDVCGAVYTRQISIQVGVPFCGDCTGDGDISASDIVCLRSYLFKFGLPPDPLCKGDANCNGSVDVGDIVYLINYFFRFGLAPCFECCP